MSVETHSAEAPNVAYFATQGGGSGDEARIAALLVPLRANKIEFDRTRKARSGLTAFRRLLRERPTSS